jgi:hypothetical protein
VVNARDPLQALTMLRIEAHYQSRAACHLLLAAALSCGGKAESGQQMSAFSRPADVPPEPRRPRPGRPAQPPMQMTMNVPPPTRPSPPTLPPGEPSPNPGFDANPESILSAYCGVCHGPVAPPGLSAGFNFINDVDRMVAAGLIIPLRSDLSPIITRVLDGSMPPIISGLPAMRDAELAILINYIDDPLNWPVSPPQPVDAGTPPPAPAADAGADAG